MNTTPKKSLRRKPPSVDDPDDINSNSTNYSVISDNYGSNNTIYDSSHQHTQLHISPQAPKAPPIPPRINTSVHPGSNFYDSILDEEDILNIETPKPMGPKSLPEFDINDTSPPYPISDPVDDIYDPFVTDFEDSAAISRNRNTEIINQSLTTPSKIPSLGYNASLGLDQSRYQTPSSSGNHEPRESRSNSPSPTRYNTFNGRLAARDNSFSRSPNSAIPHRTKTSPNRAFANSRSPSPKKIYGRSPSLMYGALENHNDIYNEDYDDYEVDNSFSYINEQDGDEQLPTTYGQFTNSYQYANQDDYYDDEYNDSPTSKLFDFSMLPDLPSTIGTSPTEDGFDNSPTKRMTLNSAISFVKGTNYLDSPSSLTRPSIKKKNDELPPVPLDLPNLPFASSSLVSKHFAACENVWSLSKIFQWCLKLKTWLHNSFISKKEFKKALIKLLVYHRRDVPLETLSPSVDQIISSLLKSGAIWYNYGTLPNEEGVKALPVPGVSMSPDTGRVSKGNPGVEMNESVKVSGVLIDLTKCYCYGDNGNEEHSILTMNGNKLRCLSSRCYVNRVLDYETKFRNTDISEIVLGEDWSSHWKLTAEDLKSFDRFMAKRQSLLFDLLRYEQTFIQRAKVFVEIVAPEFIKVVKIIVGTSQIVVVNKFDEDVINPCKELLAIHQKSLFEPLLKILISNGKFIKDIVDIGQIYYNWSQVVKSSLLKYIATIPMIEELMKIPHIKAWVDTNVRDLPKVKELRVNGSLLFLSTFNTRYQQLPLQLADVRQSFDEHDSEYVSLTKAIEGIKNTSTKVNEMKHHADNVHNLKRIHKQLVWKNSIPKININFESENRKFFHRGDVTKKGDLKINSSLNHIILLDNYVLITERIKSNRNHMVNYRIVESPIPIEFLLVEIKEKETPIELKNITNSLTQSPQQDKNEFTQEEDPSIYPFKIRYAGHGKGNSHTFSTKTDKDRTIWVNSFMKARANLCSRLTKVEPYKLRLISNTCFGYEESNKISKLQSLSDHDPLEPMAKDSVKVLQNLGYQGGSIYTLNSSNNVVFSTVISGCSFLYKTTKFQFLGTTAGVYCTDMNHEWKRIVSISDTTKISVLSSINLVIMLSGGHLRYYPLDTLIKFYYGKNNSISSLALSNEAVSFFEVGTHREMTMLFYAKKKGSSSNATNFKICIPETDNNGIFSCFKVAKKFYVQAECYGISIFNSSFAVHTSKGLEILELDKLLPRSIPELPFSDKKIDGYSRRANDENSIEIEMIRKLVHSSNSKPLGMFKLNNNNEFLLVYNECAIFVNKHGKLSRYSVLKFDFRAKSIRFHNNHLFIICDEVIEIWLISDFVKGTNRLMQVLVGKDIKLINHQDDNIIVAMANPLVPGLQLIFSLYNKDV